LEAPQNLMTLVNDGLSGFTIVAMTEVYSTDEDGRKRSSVGFFRKPEIAEAFVGAKSDSWSYKTAPALVLTNGTVGYIVNPGLVPLINDEEEALKLREHAISKLTPAERRLLGL
jgi:hypothetical protein